MAAKKAKSPGTADDRQTRHTVIKVRLYPTAEQAELIEKTFGCCRWLWNRMLADVQEFYAATDVHYIPTPARYKKEAPFLKEVDSQPLCTVHQNLRKAFLDFFRNPSGFGYPQFKKKRTGKDSFTVYCRQYRTGPSIYLTGNGIQMPKLGLVRANLYRRPPDGWSLRLVTVSKKAGSGKYFCSISFGYEVKAPEQVAPTLQKTIGLNYSLSRFYVDSEGESPALPELTASKEKLVRMQQKLSRMKHGSKNFERQLQKIRREHERIANRRRDFIHKESRRIANAWDAVCVRDTDLVGLSQKLRQGGVMDSGFGMFRACLQYKLERQGKQYIVVDRLAPAAKTCQKCGCVNQELTAHSKNWLCPECGAAVVRDINTAQNLRDMGLAQFYSQRKKTGVA